MKKLIILSVLIFVSGCAVTTSYRGYQDTAYVCEYIEEDNLSDCIKTSAYRNNLDLFELSPREYEAITVPVGEP